MEQTWIDNVLSGERAVNAERSSRRDRPVGTRHRRREPSAKHTDGSTSTFAVTLGRGPAWNPALPIREQTGWAEHAAFMDGLVDDGFVILGGPVGDGSSTLHCVAADSEDAVRNRFATDPWHRAQLFHVDAVQPWQLWLAHPGLR